MTMMRSGSNSTPENARLRRKCEIPSAKTMAVQPPDDNAARWSFGIDATRISGNDQESVCCYLQAPHCSAARSPRSLRALRLPHIPTAVAVMSP